VLGEWEPGSDRADPVALLEEQATLAEDARARHSSDKMTDRLEIRLLAGTSQDRDEADRRQFHPWG